MKTNKTNPAFIQAASRDLENGICVMDYLGNVDWTNMTFTQFYGFTISEAQSKPLQELLQGEASDAEVSEIISDGLKSGHGCSGQKQVFYHKDGTQVHVYVNIIPILGEDRESFPRQFVAYMRHVEERGNTSMITKTHKNLFKSAVSMPQGGPAQKK
jgi:PAS domain S-box-containing protein